MEVNVPVPIEPDAPTWKWIAVGAIAVVQGLMLWVARSFREEQASHDDRISKLELTPYVTREELERHVDRLESAGQRMHTDNKEANREIKDTMQRIEAKIEHGGETRHDIRDGVSAVQLMLRRTLEELKQERERNKP